MLINQAAKAPPAFFSRPYINKDSLDAGGIVVSSGDSYRKRLYDMVRETQWTSAGEDTDGVEASIDAKFYIGATQNPQAVDCIALMNHNLQRFIVEYSLSGGSWTTVPGLDFTATDYTASDYSDADLILSLAAPITMDRLRVRATHTQTPNQEKLVGLLLPLSALFQPTKGGILTPQPEESVVTVELADMSKDMTTFLRGDAGFVYERWDVNFPGLPIAELANFKARRGARFTFMPQPGDAETDIFVCRFVPGTMRYPWSTPANRNYVNFSGRIEETGGA